MTTITILPEHHHTTATTFRAVAGERASSGRTVGEALDALTDQLNEDESGTLVIVQRLRPDRFFSEAQQHRLADLMSRWRVARDAGSTLLPDEQAELESLVEAELKAATRRTEAILHELVQ